jgi:hypothetical protein
MRPLSGKVPRLRREDYRDAHLSTNFRASSAGMPSRRRACSRALLDAGE